MIEYDAFIDLPEAGYEKKVKTFFFFLTFRWSIPPSSELKFYYVILREKLFL